MSGFPAVATLINNADLGGTKPGWTAIKSILTNLNNAALANSIHFVNSVGALSGLSGKDSAFAVVSNVGIYHYNPLHTLPLPAGAFNASNGGRWDLLIALNKAPYIKVIGDSTTTVFTIKHNLNIDYPTVLQANTLNHLLNGDPYSYITTGAVEIVDSNTISITYSVAPATQSTTIIVKP